MILDLESVACFVAAAHTLNFRAAARTRNLTAAALGKRIAALEEQLGVELFQRTTRSVALTEAGRAMLPEAQRLLAQAEAVALSVRGESERPVLDLVLGTRYELGMSWILPVRALLAERLPQVTLHLHFGSAPELEARMLSMEIDCTVSSHAPRTNRIKALTLHREDYVLVGAPSLLAERPFAVAADATAHTLIDVHADLPLFAYWRPGGDPRTLLRFARILRAGTIAAIRALVMAGEGVAVLPEYFVREDLAAGTLTRLMPEVALGCDYFRLLYRASDPHESIFVQMAEVMRRVALR